MSVSVTNWWNTNYKVRRNIRITPSARKDETRINISYPATMFRKITTVVDDEIVTAGTDTNKIRLTDYRDVMAAYYDATAATPAWVPLETHIGYEVDADDERDNEFSITFKTPSGYEFTSVDTNFYLYMANEHLINAQTLALDPPTNNNHTHTAYYNSGVLTFTRPTEHWSNGISSVVDARASFTHYGYSLNVVFETGTERGIAEITVITSSGTTTQLVDTYSHLNADLVVDVGSDLTLEASVIQVRVTGDKNAASTGHEIKIERFEYTPLLAAVDLGEEVQQSTETQTYFVGI